jgi:HTH-type transcriptional repressor of NAD biosynthesis genes
MGHLQLIQFAANLPDVTHVDVLVCTQPHEPLRHERVEALRDAVGPGVSVLHYAQAIEQDPEAEGFWETWETILRSFGVSENTLVVASEPYGLQVAACVGATFAPYDFDRCLNPVKATRTRENPYENFSQIIPEFRKYLRTTVTIFGAESTGKTTLSQDLASTMGATWLFEYARPYLENTLNEITAESMRHIWYGQFALQMQADNLDAQPLVIQDTDLYSTIGYWELWKRSLGPLPAQIVYDARILRSDLYLITPSNIPFEADPLRYGGDKRETPDGYWIEICERYELPYFVLQEDRLLPRRVEARELIRPKMASKFQRIAYDRHGF